jgi:hypothetical protein
LEKLPSEIRQAAFELLQSYVTETSTEDVEKMKEKEKDKIKLKGEWKSKEDFFESFTHDKPADNIKLIAAYLYHEYGSEPFSIEEGKKLFSKSGKGKFKPTVHGEAYLKTQYNITKGTKKKAE